MINMDCNRDKILEWYDDRGWIYMPLNGKKPFISDWDKLTKPKKVNLNCNNVGILTGKTNEITVVDVDTDNDGLRCWNILNQIIDIPETLIQRTPSGGMHILFNYVAGISNSSNMIYVEENDVIRKVGIDVRNDGGQICASPSIYNTNKQDKLKYNGKQYQWVGCPLSDLADMPSTLIELLKGNKMLSIVGDGAFIKEYVKQVNTTRKALAVTNVDTSKITEVVMGLSSQRADDRGDWLKVVFALGTIAKKTGKDFSELAIEFSKQSSKFSKSGDVLEKYDNSKECYTEATLYQMLKEDNPKLFKLLRSKDPFSNLPSITELDTQRELMAQYIKQEDLSDDTEQEPEWFYYDNNKFKVVEYAKKYDVNDFIKSCIFHIVNGGNDYVMTKNKNYMGIVSYNKITSLPFQKLNDFEVWDKSEGVMTKMSLLIIKHYRLKPYISDVFVPYALKNPMSSDYINTFNGFKFKFKEQKFSEPPASISKILWHIENILANKDKKLNMVILRFCGHMFRYPETKPNFALIFHSSKMGAGKNAFTELLRNILTDQYYFQTGDLDRILTNFNMYSMYNILSVLDEALTATTAKSCQKMKNNITRTMKDIEPKGGEIRTVPDYVRYIITSNCNQPIKPEMGQRRYQMCTVSNEKVGDRSYFNELFADINNKQVQRDFFDYVSNLPNLKGFGAHEMVKTEYGEQLIKDSRPSIYNYLADIAEGNREGYEFEGKNQQLKVSGVAFLKDYNQWCDDNGEYKMTGKNIKMELNKVGIKYKTIRHEESIYKGYILYKDELLQYV